MRTLAGTDGGTSGAAGVAVIALADSWRARRETSASAVIDLADVFRATAPDLVEELRVRVSARMLRPLDPLEIVTSPVEILDVMDRETFWTRWQRALLDPHRVGPGASALAWRALCQICAEQYVDPHSPTDGHATKEESLAGVAEWRQASQGAIQVRAEVHSSPWGRLDLLIEAPGLLVVVENKLGEDWHDVAGRSPSAQSASYRNHALKERGQRKLALVLMVASKDWTRGPHAPYTCPPDWVLLTWADWARAMRAALFGSNLADPVTLVSLTPILEFIAAVERRHLGLCAPATVRGSPFSTVHHYLTRLDEHLPQRTNDAG